MYKCVSCGFMPACFIDIWRALCTLHSSLKAGQWCIEPYDVVAGAGFRGVVQSGYRTTVEHNLQVEKQSSFHFTRNHVMRPRS